MTSAKHIFIGGHRGAPTPPMPYDAEVEYLESTGTQYIDTGVVGRDGLHIEAVATRDIVATSGKNLFGVASGVTSFTTVSVNSSSGVITTGLNSLASTTSSDVYLVQDNNFHSFVLDTTGGSKYAKVDGVIIRSLDSHDTVQTERGMIIFGMRVINNAVLSSCRVSAFSVADTATGKTLVDLIPVRFTNEQGVSEGAMYDRVSGALFRNSGTGAFKFGTDIAGGGYKWLGYSPLRFSRSTRLWKEAA